MLYGPSNVLSAAPSRSGNRKALNASPILALPKAVDKTVQAEASSKAKASPVMAVEAVPKEVDVVPQAETARKAKNVRKEVVVVPREAEAIAPLEAEVAPQAEVIAAGSPIVPGPMARFVEVLFGLPFASQSRGDYIPQLAGLHEVFLSHRLSQRTYFCPSLKICFF